MSTAVCDLFSCGTRAISSLVLLCCLDASKGNLVAAAVTTHSVRASKRMAFANKNEHVRTPVLIVTPQVNLLVVNTVLVVEILWSILCATAPLPPPGYHAYTCRSSSRALKGGLCLCATAKRRNDNHDNVRCISRVDEKT